MPRGSFDASYEILDIDAQGRIRSYKYGNQVTTVNNYDVASGKLRGIQASLADGTTGAVIERLAFDPWGKRRNVNGQADTTDSLTGLTTDRGYTEHEHLDEMGLIHMNGRVYDPLVGRMMSADPFVQAPTNLKTFNRYAYVWNNPLKLYDPYGFNAQDTTTGSFVGTTTPSSPPSSSSPSATPPANCGASCYAAPKPNEQPDSEPPKPPSEPTKSDAMPQPREDLVAINWDLKTLKKTYYYVKGGFEVPENYKEGVVRGENDRQTKIDAINEINRRIEQNPDSLTTQKSAKPYKELSVDMAGPASKIVESLPDSKNPLVVIPSGAGYIKGYFDCKTCK